MIWNEHWDLKDKHATFSASKYTWINYDFETMLDKYCNTYSTKIGTILHEYCADRIKWMKKLKKSNKDDIEFELLRNNVPTIAVDHLDVDRVFDIMQLYVNDAIGYHMIPEQIVYYSNYFFGTADAISFKDKKLRIHDFKSGETPAHIEQLEIYAAFFCLEYGYHPTDIEIELRLYQSPEVIVMEPSATDIVPIMDKVVTWNKQLVKLEV